MYAFSHFKLHGVGRVTDVTQPLLDSKRPGDMDELVVRQRQACRSWARTLVDVSMASDKTRGNNRCLSRACLVMPDNKASLLANAKHH